MLQRQYRSPRHTATATELAAAAGYDNFRPANRQYGGLGRLVAEALGFDPPKRRDGTPMYWSALSNGDPHRPIGADWRFVMRPELAQALFELGWV
jgi:hypothetical protein